MTVSDKKKTVLCYGDSNTYGYDPVTGHRLSSDVRWTGVLAQLLGGGYRIVEEGCNGRTTIFYDPADPWKCGRDYLKPCFNTHKPVDIVILMLGSNDLKRVFNASAEMIASGAEALAADIKDFTMLKQGYVPDIILVSPPEIGPDIASSVFSRSFDVSAVSRSKQFPELYSAAAKRQNCFYFNAAEYIKASAEDSLHLMPDMHKKLAEKLCDFIVRINDGNVSPDDKPASDASVKQAYVSDGIIFSGDVEKYITEAVHDLYYRLDMNCARTTLTCMSRIFGVDITDQTMDAALGMHGAGGAGAQCGLVEGALMFIGLLMKKNGCTDAEVVDICKAFGEAFTERFGSLRCCELRPGGFRADDPPHRCEGLTVRSINFLYEFLKSKNAYVRK